ncbi:hypothetical protein FB451DRAFT_1371778 [Mycena latifolia]|nr:hypothetical protein FB451DRAFT_1371778 [Mycena latifolia]
MSRASPPGRSSSFRPLPSPLSDSDWLAPLILNAKAIAAGAETLPLPYVKGVFGTAVFLLETVETIQRNRNEMRELCADTVEIISVIRDRVSAHRDTAALQFKVQCEELGSFLQDVMEAVHQRQIKPRGFSARLKEVMKSSSTADDIRRFRNRIREVRSNFMLMTTVDTNFQVQKLLTVLSPNYTTVSKVSQPINNCPPPTRIFHGRRVILDKMHQYFTQSLGKQDIFLLYGLGGSGKTQIALKFVEESASQFTDIFLIDTSTIETIDVGLKTIAATKSVGDSSADGLQWLQGEHNEWLLLFDNADDPKLDLNKYFPQCSHGNILITSRNPGLCVYAGSYSHVSDMEAPDAVDLLLRSAAKDTTDYHRETAAQIVKVLHYLPLAIIQAGAFVAKSGNLESYLALYAHNRARLLNERPAQSHDDYAWTVYTTWQISFDQLSQQAKTFLQLCSFLHYQGISEDIFKNASKYTLKPSGPSKVELELPFKLLSQISGPSGFWDPFFFMDVTNELRAYSLINFDSEKNVLSIHPLVHDWTRTTLSNQEHHHCMIMIVGMSLAQLSDEDITLASQWMMPHIDVLMKGKSHGIVDFALDYAKVYLFTGNAKTAELLELTVLKGRKELLGEEHPDTLEAMYWLAWTYDELGKLKEAEELDLEVFQKRKNVLGDNHPQTLSVMGNLALVYNRLGKLKEAEELAAVLLQKQRNVLGPNHPDTLTTMGTLASIYKEQGNFQEAEQLEVVALEKWKKVLGDNHPDTMHTMGNLGVTYHRQGKFHEAEVLGLVVLEKRKNLLGGSHPDTLRSMGNLAGTYKELGRLQEAESLEVGVLEKRHVILGDNHPDTIRVMGTLAATYNQLGKLREAEELQILVLNKQKNILGNIHPDTLRTMSNLGSTFNKLEDGRRQRSF